MRSAKILWTTAVLAVFVSAPACAGWPLQTDDAGVLARGECELESVAQRVQVSGAHGHDTVLQLGCGAGWNTQIAASASTARADGQRTSCLGVDGKTALWKAGDSDAAGWTLAWGLTHAKQAGDSWCQSGNALNLLMSQPLAAQVTLHANLGHLREEPLKRSSTTWGLAFEHAGVGAERRWAPMGELFGDDREPAWWNLGLRFTPVAEKFFVHLSYGRQFAPGQPTLLTLGFKAAF